MADGMLYEVAGSILTNLGSLAFQEISLWCGVNDEIEKLKSTVSTIHSVLLDAEDKYYIEGSHQVKDWIEKLKTAMYDADDLIDDVYVEALREKMISSNRCKSKVRRFFSHSNQVLYRIKMSHKVRTVRQRLDSIKQERSFHLDERLLDLQVIRKREETQSLPPQIFIGREQDKKRILDLLFSSNLEEGVSVVSICGIGGLGKTTLAQSVLNDESVKREFQLRIWVCVSNNFDTKLIIKNILESITKDKPKDLQLETLKDKLLDQIERKKYLLVLDDIWSDDPHKWSSLANLLSRSVRGSRIIVTTRNTKVAKMTSTIIPFYELKGLSDDDSWNLLKKMAFSSRSKPKSSNYERIGREILAKKCKGVPLAIKTVGRILYFKEMEHEWSSFKDQELSKVEQNEADIIPTLKLSYYYLPSHLKHCFAFCSLYPKDHKFDVQSLIYHWVAQGYVKCQENSNQSLMEVGIECFKELLWRSFFQEVETDEFGDIVYCKMHDLMHDLAISIAGNECLLLDSSCNRQVNEAARVRHLSFDSINTLYEVSSQSAVNHKVRTILQYGDDPISTEDQCKMDYIFSNWRNLRTLALNPNDHFDSIPESIDKLKHLRYLDIALKRAYIVGLLDMVLPESVAELQNLQILNVEGWNLRELPKGITKLVNLRELNNEGSVKKISMPSGLRQLTNLERLSVFVVSAEEQRRGELEELYNLNKLRGGLTIIFRRRRFKNAESEAKGANLKAKRHLQALVLRWDLDSNDIVDEEEGHNNDEYVLLEGMEPHINLQRFELSYYFGVKCPRWISTLINLRALTFIDCRNLKVIPPLDQLPSLQELEIIALKNLQYIELGIDPEKQRPVETVFPSLQKLRLHYCDEFRGWKTSKPTATPIQIVFPQFTAAYIWEMPNFTWNSKGIFVVN